jgi:phosphoribosylanthranilate isomerase
MCGMTRDVDIAAAVKLGVDALGFIFYPQSPRHLSISQAAGLLKNRPPLVELVGVFVNPSAEWVNEVLQEVPLSCLQFHGTESPAFCEQFDRPYIKAIAATTTEAISEGSREHSHAAALLLDTPSEHHGGAGRTFDWQMIPPLEKPIIIAGGLNVHNVKAVIAACNPYAVDVCSGVEVKPGIKDHDKMRQFVEVAYE